MRTIYKLLSLLGDVRAASRGPGSYVRRKVRQQVNKRGNRALRKAGKP